MSCAQSIRLLGATARRGAGPLLAISAAGLLLAPGIAVAEDDKLEEIVVTAERKTERAQDAPLAVTAISDADLEKRGVRQAGDVTSLVPNMVMYSPYGEEAQPFFSLRGVTTNDWSQNQSSPIAMYVDDIYKSVGAVQALQAFDLDRVEILRGPQGTLYGKNATGGAVNFYSKSPSLTQTDGYVTAGFGNYSAYQVRAAIGTPLVDGKLGVRAAIYYEKRDGWMKSVVPGVEPLNGVDALAGRVTLLYKPTSDLSAQLKFALSRSGGTPYGVHAINVDPTPFAVDGFGTGFSGNYPWFNNGSKYAIPKKLDNDSASLKIDWQLSDHATLTSVTGFDYGWWYEKSDDGGLAYTDLGATIHIDDPNTYFSSVHSFSQELRIASRDSGPLNWLAGAYYGRDNVHPTVLFHFYDTSVNGYFVVPADPSNPASLWGTSLWGFDQYNSFDQVRDSKALFLNLSYEATPRLTVRGGARYTHDTITIDNFDALEGGVQSAPTALGPDTVTTWWTPTIPVLPSSYVTYQTSLVAPGGYNAQLGKSNNNLSFKVGADYRFSKDVLGYATFSQGYRGVAFNGQAYNGPAELTFTEPEKLNAYELGLKSEFFEHRLRANAAAFYYAYRNQQFLDTYCAFPAAPPSTACLGTGFQTRNAPRSRIVGVELEVRSKPDPALELGLNIGALDSKYQELFLHFADRSGNKLIMAPDLNVGAQVDWRALRLPSNDLHVIINGNYYSKQYFDALNTERIAQPGYALLNARLSLLGTGSRAYAVGLWVKNMLNRQYLAEGLPQRNPSDGNFGFDYALVGEPRTFGVDLTYNF
jgi:iron complex outermembrane recepter protein